MLHSIFVGLCVAAFLGAGVVNAAGKPAQQESFERWGYPAWWCRVTGALELAIAVSIAFPVSRTIGLYLGAIVIGAAALTLLRHRDFFHLVPVSIYIALLGLAGLTV